MPTLTPTDQYEATATGGGSWATCRAVTDGTLQGNGAYATVINTGGFQANRFGVRFDTSGYREVHRAVLRLTTKSNATTFERALVLRCTFDATMDGTVFSQVLAGSPGRSFIGPATQSTFWYVDVTELYVPSTTFELGVLDYAHDWLNVEPTGIGGVHFDKTTTVLIVTPGIQGGQQSHLRPGA